MYGGSIMLTSESLAEMLAREVLRHPLNRLESGERVFHQPLVGIASASDSYFVEFKKPEIIGGFSRTPNEWLPGAKTAISFFLPFSAAIRGSNYPQGTPSVDWLHGLFKGESINDDMKRYVVSVVNKERHCAVPPTLDKGYSRIEDFRSNWSERHVAFVAGLGTFGLSRGLITRKGMAGRFGSVVTDLDIPVTAREYSGPFEYCLSLSGKGQCGACIRRCPAHAISSQGKANLPCSRYLRVTDPLKEVRASFGYPYSACGKCQTGVPCECGIPRVAGGGVSLGMKEGPNS